MNWAAVRAEFPALADWTYLNTATYGQAPLRAQRAMAEHLARRDRLACSDFMEWFADMDDLRVRVARFIGCEAADVAFIVNASTALSLFLGGIDWRPGDRVVTLQHEFPNHYYYTSWLARRGVEFVEAPFERFHESVTERTRAVVMSTVSYATGFRAPIEEVAGFLRGRGVRFYLDGTQSVGALPIDIGAVRPDLFAVDAYKWMLTPNGGGFFYAPPETRAWLEPSILGWRSDRNWRRPEALHHGMPEFPESAERYEGGMLAFPSLYAMGAVIDLMTEIGVDAIAARVRELTAGVRRILRDAGGTLPADSSPHYDSSVITARFEGRDASAIVSALKEVRVVVAARQGNLRVSPHFYNNEADLHRFKTCLRAVL